MNRAVNALLFIGGVAFGTIFSAIIVSAWTGPTDTAPNSNVSAPLNVGSTSQTKNGVLGVNGLAVFGDTILDGPNSYLNFGATAGTNGYGIRDNAGTLEFKNTGGSWNNLTTFIVNVLGIGAVTQIKFADGTVQTTAYQTAPPPPNTPIHNNVHTSTQCTDAAGTVTTIGGGDYLCQFSGQSCPTGWTQLSNWSSSLGSGPCCTGNCGGPSPTFVAGHGFADQPTGATFMCDNWGTGKSNTCQANYCSVNAGITIGCY